MNWQAFYLGCFGVGFILSLVSFLSGALHLHLPLKWHLHVKVGHPGAPHSEPPRAEKFDTEPRIFLFSIPRP